jgi:hypothetical protein
MATQYTGPTPRETGKGRATRIPLDYFKTPNRIEKTKLGLTALAVVASGAWVAWGAFMPSGPESQYSRGPLMSKHADNADIARSCETCHVPFTAISEGCWMMPKDHRSAAEKQCQVCHSPNPKVAGTSKSAYDHHHNSKPESVLSCAGCHRDHQGRDFDLKRVADLECAACHKDLKANLKSGETTIFANDVTSFANHPQFGASSGGLKDPGRLKFNHKLHMTPGQMTSADAKGGVTLGKVRKEDPVGYVRLRDAVWQKDKSDDALVELQCASCHTVREDGRYYQPIAYDVNCKACHPLTFDADVKEPDGKRLLALPHGKPLEDLKPEPKEPLAGRPEGLLAGKLRAAFLTLNDDELQDAWPRPAGLRPLPGKDRSKPTEMPRAELIAKRTAGALRYLEGKGGCGECHYFDDKKRIQPVAVPEIWFTHARFSHAAHSKMDCKQCHGQAYESTTNTDAMLPGLKSCQECHSATPSAASKQFGTARYDCASCHNYHQRK